MTRQPAERPADEPPQTEETLEDVWTDWEDLTVEHQQAILTAPCQMMHQQPFDFAWCETHDTTFALGGACPHNQRAPA